MHVRLSSCFAVFNFMVVIIAFTASSAFAVTGSDISPGAACSVEDSVMTTANPGGTGGYVLTCESGTWKATISGETPTANEHLATKEYVDTAVAAAGGGLPIPTQYDFTTGTTQGSFNEETFCSADLGAGWRMGNTNDLYYLNSQGLFPRTASWILSLPSAELVGNSSTHAYVYNGINKTPVVFTPSSSVDSMTCSAWSSTSSTKDGTSLGGSGVFLTGCSSARPVFCVK